MKKCSVIARCLVNSDLTSGMEYAEREVANVFFDEFPHANFDLWNREIEDDAAEQIVNSVGRATRINVRMFIEDLAETDDLTPSL